MEIFAHSKEKGSVVDITSKLQATTQKDTQAMSIFTTPTAGAITTADNLIIATPLILFTDIPRQFGELAH